MEFKKKTLYLGLKGSYVVSQSQGQNFKKEELLLFSDLSENFHGQIACSNKFLMFHRIWLLIELFILVA